MRGGIKKIAVAVLFTLGGSLNSFAREKAFELKMELTINGKHISSPRIIAKEGETAMFMQEDQTQKTFIEVVATEDKIVRGKHSVLMKFVVGSIDPDGQKKVIYKPQVLTLVDHKTDLSVVEDIGLSVTASRVSL
ncbi:MAG TPA: hypothetical protein VIG33_12340 [Pseudobdellovibrionaceae bacterium]|jgi:hypothetical protein